MKLTAQDARELVTGAGLPANTEQHLDNILNLIKGSAEAEAYFITICVFKDQAIIYKALRDLGYHVEDRKSKGTFTISWDMEYAIKEELLDNREIKKKIKKYLSEIDTVIKHLKI